MDGLILLFNKRGRLQSALLYEIVYFIDCMLGGDYRICLFLVLS